MRFEATVQLEGKTATGIEVPADVVEALGGGRRPAVRITIGPHQYPTTVSVMGGRFMVPLSAAHRTAAAVKAGDEVTVDLVLDTEPRTVEVPTDLAAALDADSAVRAAFDALAYTHRKEWVRSVEEAKKPETRQRRVDKAIESLRGS